MSDVTVTGGSDAAPVSEVVVNPNPQVTPTPIGQQAPDKPVGDFEGSKHRPESRREAIQKAFDRANNPPPKEAKPAPKPAPKAAEAKPGHNQPPEPTPQEKPQPYREQGRFARQPEQDGNANSNGAFPQAGTEQQQAPKKYPDLPANAPYRDAPPRMGEHAKAEWAGTPESVRGEVARMHHEFGQAYQQYRGDHETMNSIRHFHQMAQQHGTTLDRALNNYVTMEQKLRADPIGGLDMIVNNLNLQTPDGRRLGLHDIAYHILSQSPEQQQLVQARNGQNAMSMQLGQINQRLEQQNQQLQQMQELERFRQTRGWIDQVADDGNHPRFDELADLIKNEVELGFPVEVAYRRAELLRPATQAAQTRDTAHAAQTRDPSAQTRSIDRSISGSPDGGDGSGVRRQNKGKPVGRRDAIQNAIRRVQGSF